MGKSAPKPPPAPNFVAQADAQGKANVEAARTGAALNRVNEYTPWGSSVYTANPEGGKDSYNKTVTLSPEQQALLDKQNQGQSGLADTALSGLERLRQQMSQGFDPTLPNRVNSVSGGGPYEMYNNAEGFGKQRQDVQDALYRRETAMLDPQYKQQEDDLRTRLINSGLTEGTEAYNTAYGNFANDRKNAYGDARDRSIIGAGAEESRLTGDALAKMGFNNSNRTQMLADQIMKGNFQNSARGGALDEATFRRQLPLSEFNALMTGAQPNSPHFSGAPQVAGPNAAPIFAAAQAGNQNAIDLYNQQAAGVNNSNSGTMGLLGTAAMAAATIF